MVDALVLFSRGEKSTLLRRCIFYGITLVATEEVRRCKGFRYQGRKGAGNRPLRSNSTGAPTPPSIPRRWFSLSSRPAGESLESRLSSFCPLFHMLLTALRVSPEEEPRPLGALSARTPSDRSEACITCMTMTSSQVLVMVDSANSAVKAVSLAKGGGLAVSFTFHPFVPCCVAALEGAKVKIQFQFLS